MVALVHLSGTPGLLELLVEGTQWCALDSDLVPLIQIECKDLVKIKRRNMSIPMIQESD